MKQLSPSGRDNFAAVVSMLILAIVSVFLRFVARWAAGVSLAWEDWLVLLALAFMVPYAGVMIQYAVAGPGPATFDLLEIAANVQTGGMVWAEALLKMMYVIDLLFVATISAAKLSVLALYHRIFHISDSFLRWNQITAALCILWFVISIFLNSFPCQPVHKLWETIGSTEYCIASGKLWLGIELTNLFLDVMVLCLPVVKVYKLKLPTTRKWAIGGIFLLGGLVCIASIVKLTFVWNPDRPEAVGLSGTVAWSSVHLGVAILCASLPTYAPLLRMVHKWIGLRTQSTSNSHGNNRASSCRPSLLRKDSTNDNITKSPYYRVHDPVLPHTEISGGHREAYPMNDLGPS